MSSDMIHGLIVDYGYLTAFVVAFLASAGTPLPASEILLAEAMYAGHTHRLSILVLIGVAALAGTIGGAAGYGVGRSAGAAALARWGRYVGMGPARIRLGEYLFHRYGARIVFFIRFIALISPFGGVMAGINRMQLPRFLVFNTLGAVAWAGAFCLAGYGFGAVLEHAGRTAGIVGGVLVVAVVVGVLVWLHRYERHLQAQADAYYGTA